MSELSELFGVDSFLQIVVILPSIYMTTYFFNEVKEENLHKVLILIYIPKAEKKT